MSLGFGGRSRKISEDDEFVLYEYYSYDLDRKDDKENFDGFILIKKSALLEPERREKFRRMPSGRRRKFTKIILRKVNIGELLESGDVCIENCSQAWRILPIGIDRIAICICLKIFSDYQREGVLPDKCGYFV